MQVLEGHTMGWGDLESGQVQSRAGQIYGLLHDVPLRHPYWACRPIVVEPRQVVVVLRMAQLEEAVSQAVPKLLLDPFGLIQSGYAVLPVTAVGSGLHSQISDRTSHVP
jgi:hypothetical protein